MRVCLAGGIFDKPPEYRAKHAFTPETILARGLRERGVDVVTMGLRQVGPSCPADVIHVHHLSRGALRVVTATTRPAFVFTGHSGPLVQGYRTSWIRQRAFRFVLTRCDATVALSQIEANIFSDLTRLRTPVRIIPNGIDSTIFCPDKIEAPARSGDLNILYVGQLIQLKGIDILLQAFSRLRLPQTARLTLVFQTNDLETEFRNRVRELGISDQVVFQGAVAQKELVEFYRRASVVVLPSFAESLPSVLTEAMLCGTPVIATRVGGIPEQMGNHGVLVEPGNVEQLTQALESLLANQADFRERAAGARAYAMARFSIDAMVEAHLLLYEEVASSGSQRVDRPLLNPMDAMVRLALKVRR